MIIGFFNQKNIIESQKKAMYNYQTYVKQNKLQKKCQLIRKEYYQNIHQKQKNSPSLIHSHKKRIEGFILAMVQKPYPVQLYHDQHYEPRSPQKTESIHERSFQHNHHSSKQRVNQNTQKNFLCDPVPFNNTFSHRFRDYKDESRLKPMRYKPINASLRIKEELQSKTLNQLPNITNKRINKLLKSQNFSWKDQGYSKQVNKSLLPVMHKKTYYQSLKSIFAQSPHGFLKNSCHNQKYESDNPLNKLDDYEEQIDSELNSKKQKKSSGQNMNRKQNSRQALMKCCLLGGKNTVYRIGMQKSSKKVFPISRTQNLRS